MNLQDLINGALINAYNRDLKKHKKGYRCYTNPPVIEGFVGCGVDCEQFDGLALNDLVDAGGHFGPGMAVRS